MKDVQKYTEQKSNLILYKVTYILKSRR